MTDAELIARLRKGDTPMANHYMDEAADRIEALIAELSKALEALRNIVRQFGDTPNGHMAAEIARAALAEIKGESHE